MTHLRRIVLGGVAAATMMAGAMSESFAVEPFDFTNYLRGATQGLPLGAAPPPGLYGGFGLDVTGLGQTRLAGFSGTGINAAPGYGFSLLYVPGWSFLGGTYSAAVVQGFYWAMSSTNTNPPLTGQAWFGPEIANTNFTPIALSWALGHGWFVGAALTIVGPDGSQWGSSATDGNLNPDYWTIAPGVAVSYLDANWLASANFREDINTASRGKTLGVNFVAAGAFTPAIGNGYVSGSELFGDFTVLYKVGKWQFGPVAYMEAQTTKDSGGGAGAAAFYNWQSQVAVGALVGYDFGPVSVQAWFDKTAQCANAVCGLDVWGRMSFRIWAPEAAKPLVAKN